MIQYLEMSGNERLPPQRDHFRAGRLLFDDSSAHRHYQN